MFCLYPIGQSRGLRPTPGSAYATTNARVTAFSISPDGTSAQFLIRETAPGDFARGQGADQVPVAVVPGGPIRAGNPHRALVEIAENVAGLSAGTLADLPPESPTPPAARNLAPGPGLDLLRRTKPRMASGPGLPPAIPGQEVAVITAATGNLGNSYLAVQGPPGTGKTFLGARVITALVRERGWRIGVVAQSHAVVEHLLDEVVAAGLPGEVVGKRPSQVPDMSAPETAPFPWTVLGQDDHAEFLAEHRGHGCVLGGTLWDFTNPRRVLPGDLDLLVVDEAGQFSLANTVAASISAHRLLLLGDPQQLPQVSQGSHEEPIDTSALSWIAGGAATIPTTHGYFLERTWRMHSDLCRAVSRLSYEGRLLPQTEVTDARHLEGLAPGVHMRPVTHHGNSSASGEEAREVVATVRSVLGSGWVEAPGAPARPAQPRDVLVVAPYNAQVRLVEEALAEAGLPAVRVGTVDKFQGQQAAVAILTMAASSDRDAPRGIGFLVDRHRLNVAISRAQWAAFVIHSAALVDTVPRDGGALGDVGAFLRLGSTTHHRLPRNGD